ncbi:MAG: hypothetical protein LV468_01735 [Candidatus Nitrosotenuis sp.]|uniref:hypothetical protein n=1 Tax=Candidatus Nitrosotenuis cloacae TaxID=1603555 RepID=UPI0022813284|nr:hypothetical protein [Candidatus Nitrosotenuis cloacae]MDC8437704.1 hypothetical protein [Candidatus Nitrosotenuis sp.]
MMGYREVYCENLKQKSQDAVIARRALYSKRKVDLVNELVDPICVISNANYILCQKLSKFLDDDTKAYFAMIERAATKSKTLVEELRNDSLIE